MKKEHFEFVCDHFGLHDSLTIGSERNCFIGYDIQLYEAQLVLHEWGIYGRAHFYDPSTRIFCGLTEDLATEIINYIKETEILFI